MPTKLYESYTTINCFDDTFGSISSLNTPCYLAQSFTIGTVGANEDFTLDYVNLALQKAGTPTGDLIVNIWQADANGTPTNIISTGTISMGSITVGMTTISISNFNGVTFLTSGKYAVSIYHANATNSNKIGWAGGLDTDPQYGANDDNDTIGAAWIKDATSSTWIRENTINDPRDFYFQIYGLIWNATLCTYEDVYNKAGYGASPNANSALTIGNFVRQSESEVNARTCKNWTDIYNTLNSDVKYILNETVSSLAAIKVINYNMAGYTTRLEAEGMKKTLADKAELLIKELKEQQIKSFIVGA